MARTFISPSKYIQGPGELDNIGTYVSNPELFMRL